MCSSELSRPSLAPGLLLADAVLQVPLGRGSAVLWALYYHCNNDNNNNNNNNDSDKENNNKKKKKIRIMLMIIAIISLTGNKKL